MRSKCILTMPQLQGQNHLHANGQAVSWKCVWGWWGVGQQQRGKCCDANYQLSWGVFTEGQADWHIFSQNSLEATAGNCLSITLSFVDNSCRHLGHCHTVTLVHWNWQCQLEVQAMLHFPHLCLFCSPLTSGWAEWGTCLTWLKMQFVVAVVGNIFFSVVHSGELHKGWGKREGENMK